MCLWVEHRDLLPFLLIPRAGHDLEQMVGVSLSMAVWHAACMQQGSLVSAQHQPKASGPELLYMQGHGVTADYSCKFCGTATTLL